MGNAFRCGLGHTFDIAKEGHVNLLLANQKASLSPGDTKAMVAARRAFLERGHYAPLSDRINTLAGEHLAGNGTADVGVLDAGCGEGYYLHRLQRVLPSGAACYGLDISKEAVKAAAARSKDSTFFVASIHRDLPVAGASLDILLNVFAPRDPAEFARVLRPTGRALVVVPAEGHLAALHDVLEMPRIGGDKARRAVEDFDGALVPLHVETLRYRRAVPPTDTLDLIYMTPTGGQLPDRAWAGARSLPSLDIEFAFTLIVLRRASEAALENE